jgi:hypothetical protein
VDNFALKPVFFWNSHELSGGCIIALMSIAIGKILQAAREERGLTLDQVAGATHIRLRYLQAMEAGDFEALPSRLQVKGFLRSYASYLGLKKTC